MTDTPQPVFIVGSPRSGTKILRDTLGAHENIEVSRKPFETVWKYGQEHEETQGYSPETLTPDIQNHVRSFFENRFSGTEIFVEKNVYNSLRVSYIRAIFPSAKFIHIVRDGRDVAASLRQYRRNPVDWSYYLSPKIFRVNPLDVFNFGTRALYRIVKRSFRGGDQVRKMGPYFEGYFDLIEQLSSLDFSAVQWARCVRSVRDASQDLPGHRYHELHFENLMTNHDRTLKDLTGFLELRDVQPFVNFAESNFEPENQGKWKDELTVSEYQLIEGRVGELLSELGYVDCRLRDGKETDVVSN